MTRRLPALRPRRVIRALQRAGFAVDHVTGSHHILRHPGQPHLRVTVAYHNRDIKQSTLRSIIRQAGLSVDESSTCFEHRFSRYGQM